MDWIGCYASKVTSSIGKVEIGMVTGRNEELDEAHDRTIERGYLINLVKNYVFSRDGRFSSFSRDMVLVFNF